MDAAWITWESSKSSRSADTFRNISLSTYARFTVTASSTNDLCASVNPAIAECRHAVSSTFGTCSVRVRGIVNGLVSVANITRSFLTDLRYNALSAKTKPTWLNPTGIQPRRLIS